MVSVAGSDLNGFGILRFFVSVFDRPGHLDPLGPFSRMDTSSSYVYYSSHSQNIRTESITLEQVLNLNYLNYRQFTRINMCMYKFDYNIQLQGL